MIDKRYIEQKHHQFLSALCNSATRYLETATSHSSMGFVLPFSDSCLLEQMHSEEGMVVFMPMDRNEKKYGRYSQYQVFTFVFDSMK